MLVLNAFQLAILIKKIFDRLEALNNNLIAKNVAELEDLINKYAK